MQTRSRLPVPNSTIKRDPSTTIHDISLSSPTRTKSSRLAPVKYVLPSQLSPSTGVKGLSLAPSLKSPLATPPRRNDKNRLSMYGVPVTMEQKRASGLRSHVTATIGEIGEKRIIVCARKRPLSSSEIRLNGHDCLLVDQKKNFIKLTATRTKLDGLTKYNEEFEFSFDRVFDENCSNRKLYKDILSPLTDFTLQGGKTTCFAYGQTGSGKTHTMFHQRDGVCFLAMEELLNRCGPLDCYISFFEIYQGHLYDLLNNRRRVVPCEKGNGQVKIMGLEEVKVSTIQDARDLIVRGLTTRMTGKTGANSQSSRSHAILQFSLCGRNPDDFKDDKLFGRMSFIDLAGSERGADRADVDRKTKMEGSEINKSLLALKECIRALDQDSSHLPFRQSKLTLVLKDSIVGNVKTAMISTISPSTNSAEHTLNTLRYAERFHEIGGGGGGVASMENSQLPSNTSEWATSPLSLSKTIEEDATPVKKVVFEANSIDSTSDTSNVVAKKRDFVKGILEKLKCQALECQDSDILELLGEELVTLSQALQSLS